MDGESRVINHSIRGRRTRRIVLSSPSGEIEIDVVGGWSAFWLPNGPGSYEMKLQQNDKLGAYRVSFERGDNGSLIFRAVGTESPPLKFFSESEKKM